jgi:hypothetical protein
MGPIPDQTNSGSDTAEKAVNIDRNDLKKIYIACHPATNAAVAISVKMTRLVLVTRIRQDLFADG